jgi:hypothetical protein
MTDAHDAIERLRSFGEGNGHLHYDDARAIIAHIDALTAERDTAVAALAQRDAQIVAWLRSGFDVYPHGTFARCREMQSYWNEVADAIEAGDYKEAGDE